MDDKISYTKALSILNQDAKDFSAEQLFQISQQFKNENLFSIARRFLGIARTKENNRAEKIDQQYALCTYKDVDLPIHERLDQALKILKEGATKLEESASQETLGLAGAIFKRKWEYTGQHKNLESSRHYYLNAFNIGGFKDDGYTAVNAAYILDLLASQSSDDSSKETLKQSDEIRLNLVSALEGKAKGADNPEWFLCASLAEACFGLGRFQEAGSWLQKGKKNPPQGKVFEWELESTSKQLAQIAIIRKMLDPKKPTKSDAWIALKVLYNEQEANAALTTTFGGKIGLALSGGGFRAALYHIGVLARLAESDMLRRVEVLSCVSGGSILGAYYYLKVKHLLETKRDDEIEPSDYISIVQATSHDFLLGVQKNMRMRVLTNWWCNIKMLFTRIYSRTHRLGELYEEILYKKITGSKDPIFMHDLHIAPLIKGDNGQDVKDEKFRPKFGNWRRESKVPILILNATTLNTGHNWQFTGSFMGEAPSSVQKIDGNYRLRRMYYKPDSDKPVKWKIRLGYAVAASSCVPGMFEPLALPNLYENKTIRLVDGGVHDNQGVTGLLEQDCNVMLVSDASGQMGSIDNPSPGILGVLPRTNDILMERVRNAQFQDIEGRYQQGRLKALMFIHLKLELDVRLIDWVGCEDPQEQKNKQLTAITTYDVNKGAQRKIAAIRTDLDSFHDTEAHALMNSGYAMTDTELPKSVIPFSDKVANAEWDFLSMKTSLNQEEVPEKLLKLLRVSSERFLKIWRLSMPLKILGILVVTGLIIIFAPRLVCLFTDNLSKPVLTWSDVAEAMFYFILSFVVGKWLLKILRLHETVIRWTYGAGLITLGWLLALIHVYCFDWIYLKLGKR